MSNFLQYKFLRNRLIRVLLLGALTFFFVVFLWPGGLPDTSYSTIINDSEGQLLSAKVASDGQWRFPKPDSVPHRVSECIRYFEDEYFYQHPGVNPVSLVRATWQNVKNGKVISGASTITMQIARMSGNNERTFLNKVGEMFKALKLDLINSKDDLMIQYASMAPFGGNVVGLEAASWRYYGRAPHLLSWAESATLAVLPNNPGAIFPGTQDSLLIKKRNRLLKKLLAKGVIDELTWSLAIQEPVPDKPLKIPSNASHLLTTFSEANEGARLNSTIDPFWQSRVSVLVENHHQSMSANGVENLAAMVVDLSSGDILAYKGNTDDPSADGYQVDIIQKPRSPGSSLKPLLFTAALDKGLVLRKSFLPDVPSFFGGFAPKNFNHGYLGAVNANVALSRSLNIPLVHLLQKYSYEQFHQDLKEIGFSTLDQPAGHYGLTLVLGGCEVKMWDMAQAYFSMYRKVSEQPNLDIHFSKSIRDRKSLDYGQDAIWQTFQTMTSLARPEGEKAWRSFSSSQLIAWKTGTSHGFRDAWAVGLNGNVLVLVWVGNADGEGRADLTGIKAAAPLLHSIMRLSDSDPKWLENSKPFMRKEKVCQISGMLADEHCPTVEQEVCENASKSGLCTYHRHFVMDKKGQYRVNSNCYQISESTARMAFILPSIQGFYYRQTFPDYAGMPPLHPDCMDNTSPIAIIYPNEGSKVFIPKEITGEKGRLILQATHQTPREKIYWHVDDLFLGETSNDHQMSVWLAPGEHLLALIDSNGNRISRRFEVIGE